MWEREDKQRDGLRDLVKRVEEVGDVVRSFELVLTTTFCRQALALLS